MSTAGIDLDSLTRYDHQGCVMAPDATGDYLLVVDVRELLARRAEPSVAADERALFEAWAKAKNPDVPLGKHPCLAGEYFDMFTQSRWVVWQARAALASPAVSQMDVSQSPLTDEQLDQIARAYFAEEYAQEHVKNAIHDAFVEAGRAALARAPLPGQGDVQDTERLNYIASNAVRGATYQGVTSVNIIVYSHELVVGGLRHAIDCMRERAAMSASQGEPNA